VSPDQRSDGGVPRHTLRLAALPGTASAEERWPGANQAKDEKLRVRSLQRRAGGCGYELRHSDSGYALIDASRKPVDGRDDMSLKEIESLLTEALGR
jgi:hypothetical protein